MNALLLISIILGVSAQDITKKMYNKKVSAPGVYVFTTLSAVTAAVFFALTSGSLDFNLGILPYSVAFAVAYTTGVVGSVVAIASGPLSLTTLIVSFSLMLPTLYGLVFLNDPISLGLFPGIALLTASLFFINRCDKGVKINTKWLISVTFAFLGNGFCTIFQKMQQIRFDGNYKNEFMIIALAITALAAGVMTLIKERDLIGKQGVLGCSLGVICGAANGAVNLFVMILSGLMPVSLMFPIISAGGIVATFIISQVFYKEKLSRPQLIGFILGTASVVLLNL
ncbi:MAG: hypothetical protein E7587_10290 [Ruminococcaceae bacterium]|nr:hypothetical protein [Oscillospiraceae bacterium]